MRILLLCKKFPYPITDGEAIAIFQMIKALKIAGNEVSVLCMNTHKHRFNENDLPEWVQQVATFKSVFVDTKIKATEAFKNLFTNSSYNIQRFYCKAFSDTFAL